MKRFIIISAALLCGIAASAQQLSEPVVTETSNDGARTVTSTMVTKNVLTNDFKYNWELIGLLGTQFYYGENDKYLPFFQRFTFPTLDIMLNKWASPSIGFAVGVTGLRMKGLYQFDQTAFDVRQDYYPHFMSDEVFDGMSKTNTEVVDGHPITHDIIYKYQKGWYINPYIVAMFDLSNLIGGVKADRFYTAQFYAGGGVALGMDKDEDADFPQLTGARGVTFNTGLLNKFRINENFDFVLNLRGALVSDEFDGECRQDEPYKASFQKKNFPFDGIAGITAGLCLHFGVKKDLHTWKNASSSSTDHYVAPVVIPGEKVIVHDTLEVARPVDPELWFHIQFKIDRTEIQPRERINVNTVADFIKSAPDTRFLVCGFADVQTSYPEHNLWLSEHRAKNVYNMLINEFGVNPDQLDVDYKGGVDYMFYTQEELSRCVMIIPLVGKNIEQFGQRALPADSQTK
ncbi:MAG: OmpA family protein [Bacteroidales bacterium]|nr:OmpA family protein [Candidatus Cryptobacteroides aphodequi]